MLAYFMVNFSVILLATFFLLINRSNLNMNNENKTTTVFLLITFLVLLLISGFRGGFTSDYKNYSNLFHYFNSFSWSEFFNQSFYEEPGFIVLNKIIGSITNNEVYFFLITSFIILALFFREFRRDSMHIWISILLFINIGAFYTSFNILRQIIAVSIIFAGSRYLYNRQFIKYVIIIFIASLFHQTSWLILPFYFLLNLKFNIKNAILTITLSLFTILFLDSLIDIILRFISKYSGYAYGMTGLNITSAVVPVMILIFVLIHHKLIRPDSIKQRIWINASFYYAFFSILGLKVQMLQRFAEFFNPFILLIIPLIIYKILNKNLRVIYIIIITFLLIGYNLIVLSGTGYDPYYFMWEYR